MSLTRQDFDAFFRALHDDKPPFDWQRRLLDTVLDSGGWPAAVVAPTGSGKTAVIDVHVFALAVAVAEGTPPPPRRLTMIVNRRVLVDDQHRHAEALAARLAEPGDSPILAQVAELLWRLQCDPAADRSPLLVARLRGGLPSSRRWVDHPTAAAVLCATPEMWGSRLLFRGYGSSPRAWPREAGLLAFDTVAVVDEAHLAQQLLRTARRVRELVPVADHRWNGPPVLQVVETTATPTATGGDGVSVEEGDLATSDALRARLCRPKPVTLVPTKNWPATTRSVAEDMARRTVGLLDGLGTGTVGCFVNTVAQAVAVSAALRDIRITGRKLTVVMLCGQVRPIDVALLENHFPGLLSTDGHPDVDVLVATQTLEVGVDLDLAAMVTELASGSAVAQRAGRVNRRGLADTGPVEVIVPHGPIRADARSGPYQSTELTAARTWLEQCAADPRGLAPWTLRADPPPVAGPRRTLLQRPELGQVWHWARTSDDLVADPELDLWLSDDLEPDSAIGIIVRNQPTDLADAVELVKLLLPRPHEIFTIPLRTARQALTRAGQLDAVLVRGDDVGPLEWTQTDGEQQPRIRPGDLIVLDAATPLFTESTTADRWSPPVIATGEDIPLHPAADVLEAPALLRRELGRGAIVHRIELDQGHPLAALLALDPDDVGAQPPDEREVVQAWLDIHADGRMAREAALLLRTSQREVDVIVQRDPNDAPVRILVIDGRRAVADEYVRQEWTRNPNPVFLKGHQSAVADRVVDLAGRLTLDDDLVAALREAALHHDDGKADHRFQIRLGNRGARLLAKSHDLATPEAVRRRLDRSGLPPRWRHEQRSVADAWPAIPPEVDRDLVARLIGTTHGHGRSWFPHVAEELLHPTDAPDVWKIAAMLFDEGGWDELIERTHLRYGVWGCAYLEAVLRAADGQISGEGR